MKIDTKALEIALTKIRKLRLVDHVPIKDSAPPAVTFKAVIATGLGGMYDDAAIEYVMRHFLKYYFGAMGPVVEKTGTAAADTSVRAGAGSTTSGNR